MAPEKSSSKGQAWFCTTGLPSDIVIEVDDMSFHLHKFPLMSKSRKLHQLITEQETSTEEAEQQQQQEGEEEVEDNGIELHITLQDFPGSSETFELAAKFCYGVKFELTSSNVVPLRCAGEFLEMAEDYSEKNLISRTETFLTQSVLKSVKESIKTLKSCEAIMSLAETIDIPQRLINSIAARASSTDPSLFGWPINEGSSEANQILWNGIDTGARRKKNADSWFEDLALLSLPLYKRLISAMKAQDLSSEIVENSLIIYAKKSIPGLSRSTRKLSSTSSMVVTEAEQRELIETIITNLPLEKNKKRNSSSTSTTGVRHLFGLLRTANILNVSESCRTVLEQKIALRLENASLDDLLIPSYSYLIETLYDVECVERILGYYLDNNLGEGSVIEMDSGDLEECGGRLSSPLINPVMLVGKLIDGYLSEIASDANLKPQKFYDLAVALPDQARLFDDANLVPEFWTMPVIYHVTSICCDLRYGVYYGNPTTCNVVSAHPGITEEERENICGVLDCQKLTLEACTHAAQNERLPLRAVVQVLFFEQLQLRNAIAGSLLAADLVHPESARPPLLHLQQQQHEQRQCMELVQDNNTWNTAIRENQVLRLDMDSMRSRVHELERECSTMKKVIKKIDQTVSPDTVGWRNTLGKKFGCKFKTQVCDSHERTVVEAKKGRHNRNSSLVLLE
ncbi:hypothetical protein IFM89_012635 [Coptis chinensis]|uniref:Phototropic-responsive NPH3 family protein n=1 Tax=Coptis chinensis TaxID=261450 RepID=A0A835IRR6_9MAGN|nr:hypothetical protein IFM89_012635 [Coptis chinensis]